MRLSPEEVSDIAVVLASRPVVLKALEDQRAAGQIGSSLEAKVILRVKDKNLLSSLRCCADELRFVFIVSQVLVEEKTDQAQALDVAVARADGQKCSRCWNYAADVDADASWPGLCGRCAQAVREAR